MGRPIKTKISGGRRLRAGVGRSLTKTGLAYKCLVIFFQSGREEWEKGKAGWGSLGRPRLQDLQAVGGPDWFPTITQAFWRRKEDRRGLRLSRASSDNSGPGSWRRPDIGPSARRKDGLSGNDLAGGGLHQRVRYLRKPDLPARPGKSRKRANRSDPAKDECPPPLKPAGLPMASDEDDLSPALLPSGYCFAVIFAQLVP